MTRYRECDVCKYRTALPDGVDEGLEGKIDAIIKQLPIPLEAQSWAVAYVCHIAQQHYEKQIEELIKE